MTEPTSNWLDALEAPDWHAIAASQEAALASSRALLGARPWTEPLRAPVPDWLIPGLLQRKAIHVISSDKGCYKTWLGLSYLVAGIYGLPVLGEQPTCRFSTLYVAADSPDWDIGAQLSKLLAAHSLKPLPGDSFILPYGVQFTNDAHVTALIDLIAAWGIDHLAIDVKGYTQGHLDENLDSDQMLYYRVMKHFRDKLDLAVTIFHHFGKTNKTARGAGTVEQAAEHCFHLFKTKTGVRLFREKIRGDELWTERLFTLGHQNSGRLLVPVEAALTPPAQPAPPSGAREMGDVPPVTEVQTCCILSALAAPKTRDQLTTIALSAGKTRKWLDNRLQYLKRTGRVSTDGAGLWTLQEAPNAP